MKHILSVVIFILVTAAASLFAQPQLDKSRELIKQKKYTEAINECKAYLQANPDDENGWLVLSHAYVWAGMLDAAEDAAKKAIENDDEMLDAYRVLAEVQLKKKNPQLAYSTAKAGLNTIGKKDTKYPPLLIVLGQALLELDSADAALVAASEAREIDPQNVITYEVIGDSYLKQGVSAMAINSYERSLEIDSMQIRVLYKLANAHIAERHYTEAARVYYRILAMDPKNKASRYELASLLFKAKQYSNCAVVLKEYFAIEKNPSKEFQTLYIQALLKSRQFKEAAAEGRRLQAKEPNSTLAHRAIANGFYNENKFAQAVESFKKIDTLEFDDYRWLGESYRKLKKDTLAARVWEKIVDDTTESLNIRSYYLDQIASVWMVNQRMYSLAADFYQKRIELDPDAHGAYINYAQCKMQLERFTEAETALKTVIEKNPKIPSAYVTLGFCYFQMKAPEKGEDEFRKAIKVIDTAEFKYRYDLADSYRMIGYATMLRKKATYSESQAKWEEAAGYLRKSLRYREDVAQTHLLLAQCYQNLEKIEDAVREYRRVLKLDPKNKDAKAGLDLLE
ncbi:MAG: tetratricopeptide repeat protein [Bacteroidetes bacterium]|nr:tetratricopeptide repeat protein [Bacteroidota bacterium]